MLAHKFLSLAAKGGHAAASGMLAYELMTKPERGQEYGGGEPLTEEDAATVLVCTVQYSILQSFLSRVFSYHVCSLGIIESGQERR